MSQIEDLDDDDRFLIRTLYRKGRTIESIANKRKATTETIQDVINEFKKKGNTAYQKARRSNDEQPEWRPAAFWFFQHGKYIKDDVDVQYGNSISKAEFEYPGFKRFLEGETKRDTDNHNDKDPGLDVNSKWPFVQELWTKKFQVYSVDEDDGADYECKNNKAGEELVGVDVEEMQQDAVCQIVSKEGKCLGSGVYVEIGDKSGILTLHEILQTEEACRNASVEFFLIPDIEICRSLKPNVFFLKEQNLNATFVALEKGIDDCVPIRNIKDPLTIIKGTKKEQTICGYFYDRNGTKRRIQNKTVDIESDVFYYKEDQARTTGGMPIYSGNCLIGLDLGRHEKGTQIATNIKKIEEWVKINSFFAEDKVRATWSDGFVYDATIKHKTETGYMVYYDDFDQSFDQLVKTLERKDKQATQKTKNSTTTTASTPNTRVLDEDDIVLILAFLEKGRNAEQISNKLKVSVDCIQKIIDKNKKIISVNQKQLPFNEEQWQKFCKWLIKFKMEKYIDTFKAHDCHSIEVMLTWDGDAVIEILTQMGVKSGACYKFKNLLAAAAVYGAGECSSKLISKIDNKPMAMEWKPTNELDLTEAFKKPGTGKASISYCHQQLLAGKRPKELTVKKGNNKETQFYVKSATHERYFEIIITWK